MERRRPELRASYRIQLTPELGFAAVAELCDYLAELGISHLYASPVLQAAAGSTHGYDVVDHGSVSAELGGEGEFDRMCAALRERGIGVLLDIVPNHMAIGTAQNALWWDVLENGPASEYAAFFDVDWDAAADNRVLLPILGERYIEALEQGLIRLVRGGARFVVRYHDHAMPAAPRSLEPLLAGAACEEQSAELAFVADKLGELPHAWTTDRVSAKRRRRDVAVLFAQLERLVAGQPAIARGSTPGSSGRTGGSRSGAQPRPSSATGASSTSRGCAGCASRTRRSSRARMHGCWRGCRRAVSTACASITPTVCAIRRSISSACTRRRRTRTWWWRRSCSPEKRCARAGRWPARPATS